MSGWRVAVYQPLLGTNLEVRVLADSEQAAALAESAVVEQVQHLSSVFSVFDPASELRRWRGGEVDAVSADLAGALALAQSWFDASGAALHPGCRVLLEQWQQAEASGVPPDPPYLADLADRLAELPFRVSDGRVARVGDCTGVDLNAFVKGHVVDRALERGAAVPGVRALVVNAGGDLRHCGAGEVSVRLEDPRRPHDNAEPLTRVRVSNAAVATSGSVHRGFRVGGRWFGHVLDPRTGWPVQHTVSASVLAPDAATADALSTVVMVLPPREALQFLDRREDGAALLVDADGRTHRSARWPPAS